MRRALPHNHGPSWPGFEPTFSQLQAQCSTTELDHSIFTKAILLRGFTFVCVLSFNSHKHRKSITCSVDTSDEWLAPQLTGLRFVAYTN